MASGSVQAGLDREPTFIVEKGGRLYLAATIAEYGEAGGGSSELRQMFSEGRRSAPLEAVEVDSVKRTAAAVSVSSESEGEPPAEPKPAPSPPEPQEPTPPPSPGPKPADEPPGVGTEPPGVGTEPPALGTNPG